MARFPSRQIGYLLCVLMLIAATFSIGDAQQIQYGVYIGDQSVVNPNPNFNLYSAGANSKNVFEGNVFVGTTTNPGWARSAGVIRCGNPPTLQCGFFHDRGTAYGSLGVNVYDDDSVQRYAGNDVAGKLALNGNWLVFTSASTGTAGSPITWTHRLVVDGDTGNVGIGINNPTSRLHVVGDFIATGVKNFQIAHPVEPERKLLIHSALEGPEAGVYYRGEAQLKDGKAEVILPAYFEALTRKGERTVQLTPIAGWSPLYVVEGIQDGQFTVRAAKEGNPAQRFYWEVKAVRADVPTLVVEKLKEVQ